jgi:predicted transcriptional regulator of viral defense system
MLREPTKIVHELAADQHGYFTTEQAREAGVDHRTLAMMCRRGTVAREAQGLYRDPLIPATRWGPYMAAVLWPKGVQGVLSHETALNLFELSDVNPGQIHVTVPKGHRTRRQPPPAYRLHRADIPRADTTTHEGLPVTTVARTLKDCHSAHIGPALIRQALGDARRLGYLAPIEAEVLERELLQAPSDASGARGD